jgi:hypothetical protein
MTKRALAAHSNSIETAAHCMGISHSYVVPAMPAWLVWSTASGPRSTFKQNLLVIETQVRRGSQLTFDQCRRPKCSPAQSSCRLPRGRGSECRRQVPWAPNDSQLESMVCCWHSRLLTNDAERLQWFLHARHAFPSVVMPNYVRCTITVSQCVRRWDTGRDYSSERLATRVLTGDLTHRSPVIPGTYGSSVCGTQQCTACSSPGSTLTWYHVYCPLDIAAACVLLRSEAALTPTSPLGMPLKPISGSLRSGRERSS